MKKLRLSKSDFDFLSANMELSAECVESPASKDGFVEFQVADYTNFQITMNFDIINAGMDNQNTVNEIGKRMYKIYDEILTQK
nr:MAG TPA: hypothetical protein [Caudoviricetes sp.]